MRFTLFVVVVEGINAVHPFFFLLLLREFSFTSNFKVVNSVPPHIVVCLKVWGWLGGGWREGGALLTVH